MLNFGNKNHTGKFRHFLEVLFAPCQVNQDVASIEKLFPPPKRLECKKRFVSWSWLSLIFCWKIWLVKTAQMLAKDKLQPLILAFSLH